MGWGVKIELNWFCSVYIYTYIHIHKDCMGVRVWVSTGV